MTKTSTREGDDYGSELVPDIKTNVLEMDLNIYME